MGTNNDSNTPATTRVRYLVEPSGAVLACLPDRDPGRGAVLAYSAFGDPVPCARNYAEGMPPARPAEYAALDGFLRGGGIKVEIIDPHEEMDVDWEDVSPDGHQTVIFGSVRFYGARALLAPSSAEGQVIVTVELVAHDLSQPDEEIGSCEIPGGIDDTVTLAAARRFTCECVYAMMRRGHGLDAPAPTAPPPLADAPDGVAATDPAGP